MIYIHYFNEHNGLIMYTKVSNWYQDYLTSIYFLFYMVHDFFKVDRVPKNRENYMHLINISTMRKAIKVLLIGRYNFVILIIFSCSGLFERTFQHKRFRIDEEWTIRVSISHHYARCLNGSQICVTDYALLWLYLFCKNQ